MAFKHFRIKDKPGSGIGMIRDSRMNKDVSVQGCRNGGSGEIVDGKDGFSALSYKGSGNRGYKKKRLGSRVSEWSVIGESRV